MKTQRRLLSKFVLLLLGAAAIGATFATGAEARQHRRYVVRPTAYIVDDWGRCWVHSRGVWWRTVCDARFGYGARYAVRY